MLSNRDGLRRFAAAVIMITVCVLPAGAWGKKKKGETIVGYLWATNTTPAPGKQVILINAETGKMVQVDNSNMLGKYKFKNVPPGKYIVRTGKFSRTVYVVDKTVRVHFNFSTPDGEVDFAAAAQENAKIADELTGNAAADPGPSDPALVRWIAGEYYSFEGQTERKLMLCPSGIYYDSRESSYSGVNKDSLGYETSSFGAASQDRGNGRWSIQGNRQSGTITFSSKGNGINRYQYRNVGDNCIQIGAVKFCYAGQPRCN